MTKTGTGIVTAALRGIKVLDPRENASGALLTDGLDTAEMLLDEWRVDHLTMGGVLIGQYNLVANQASYTIGVGGDFDQMYPERIQSWSVIPDRNAAHPLEIPMGRPLTSDEWQAVSMKNQTGPKPTRMYFDEAWSTGLGNCVFHQIPNVGIVAVVLYSSVPAITALAAATSYNLRPGAMNALILNLGLALSDAYGSAATVTPRFEMRAAKALGALKRSNIRPRESGMRPEYAIGNNSGRRTFNIYKGGV